MDSFKMFVYAPRCDVFRVMAAREWTNHGLFLFAKVREELDLGSLLARLWVISSLV